MYAMARRYGMISSTLPARLVRPQTLLACLYAAGKQQESAPTPVLLQRQPVWLGAQPALDAVPQQRTRRAQVRRHHRDARRGRQVGGVLPDQRLQQEAV